jgi:hypothetical protein
MLVHGLTGWMRFLARRCERFLDKLQGRGRDAKAGADAGLVNSFVAETFDNERRQAQMQNAVQYPNIGDQISIDGQYPLGVNNLSGDAIAQLYARHFQSSTLLSSPQPKHGQ